MASGPAARRGVGSRNNRPASRQGHARSVPPRADTRYSAAMPALPPSFLVATTTSIAPADWPAKPSVKLFDTLIEVVPVGGLDPTPRPFEVRLGWAAEGLLVGVRVTGKSKPAADVPNDPHGSDSVVVCLDTRDTKSIRRAGRFCHRFRMLPTFEGKPWVRQEVVPRAREDAKTFDGDIPAAAKIAKDGYTVVAAVPVAALTGYDPAGSPRLGFHAELTDAEHGSVPWAGDRSLPSDADPSLWQSVELVAGQ